MSGVFWSQKKIIKIEPVIFGGYSYLFGRIGTVKENAFELVSALSGTNMVTITPKTVIKSGSDPVKVSDIMVGKMTISVFTREPDASSSAFIYIIPAESVIKPNSSN